MLVILRSFAVFAAQDDVRGFGAAWAVGGAWPRVARTSVRAPGHVQPFVSEPAYRVESPSAAFR